MRTKQIVKQELKKKILGFAKEEIKNICINCNKEFDEFTSQFCSLECTVEYEFNRA